MKIPTVLFSLLLTISLFSATEGMAQSVIPLNTDVALFPDSLVLDIFPTSAETWLQVKDGGYRIERYRLKDIDFPQPPARDADWDALTVGVRPEIFPSSEQPLLMADSATLQANALVGSGYIGAVAVMLYDSAFNAGTDRTGIGNQQYEMVAFGALNIPRVAGNLLGSRWYDAPLDRTATFLYRIIAENNPAVRQEVIVDVDENAWVRYQTEVVLDFSANPFAGQLPPAPTAYTLASMGKGFKDSLVLRWAPLDADLLRESFKQGYTIRKQKEVEPAKEGRLPVYEPEGPSITVSPWSAERFAAYFERSGPTDSLVYVSAQTLYGEVTPGDDMTRSEILDNQLAFGLQSADISAKAADALGLRWVDYDVEPGATYRYIINMPLDSVDTLALPLIASIQLENTYEPVPPISGFTADEGEYRIFLKLDAANQKAYNYYYFERAPAAGGAWEPLAGGRPIIFEADQSLGNQLPTFLYPNEVAALYEPYRYRVRGRNFFQEYSPWVELTAMARDRTPTSAPVPEPPLLVTEEVVNISWDGEVCEEYPDFAGFRVSMGHRDNETAFSDVSPLLPAGTSSFEYARLGVPFTTDSVYFFRVSAVDTAGNLSSSFAYMLSIVDSIPPAPPVGLQGKIDTNGIVTVFWEASPEKDAAGYQVYFANDSSDIFTQVTEEDLIYNYFRDTIPLRTLNDAIFYRVSAFDARFNTSGYSEILRLERPDVIPPTPPVLLQPMPTGTAIELSWKPTASTDAVGYLLQRRPYADDEAPWATIDSLSSALISYADTSARAETTYRYRLVTVDDAGWYSEPSNDQSGRRIFDGNVGGVSALSVSLLEADQGDDGARTQVQWQYEKQTAEPLRDLDYRFMIYRGIDDEPLTRYKQLRGKDPVYTDKDVKAGKTYRYALVVVYEDGKKSSISEMESVTIPSE